MDKSYRVLGQSVRWYREESLQITDAQFADQVGLPIDVLRQIETGDCKDMLGELILISLNSEFPLDDVLDEVIERDRPIDADASNSIARSVIRRSSRQ